MIRVHIEPELGEEGPERVRGEALPLLRVRGRGERAEHVGFWYTDGPRDEFLWVETRVERLSEIQMEWSPESIA